MTPARPPRLALRVLGTAILLCAVFPTSPAAAQTAGLVVWGMERALPGSRVKIGEARWLGPALLVLSDLRLTDRATGRELASASEARIRFDYRNLLGGRIEEVVLVHPILRLSPEFLAVLPDKKKIPSSPASAASLPWRIARLRCDFGEAYAAGFSDPPLFSSCRFSFDWRDFGGAAVPLLHELTIWAAAVSPNPDFSNPFLSLDLLRLRFSLEEFLRDRKITGALVEGGNWVLGKNGPGLPAENPAAAPRENTPPITIEEIEIRDLETRLEGMAPGGAEATFSIRSKLRNIPLGNLGGAVFEEEQHIELANIEVLSPDHPDVRIVTLHSLFAYFTIRGALENRIRQIVILNPTLYITEDLFAYMERMRAQQAEEGESRPEPWVIGQLRMEFGRVVLGGQPEGGAGLPLSFQSAAENVSLESLASLRLDASLEVEPQNFDFPALQLRLENLRGNWKFAYPPQKNPDNLVNVLYLDSLRWRQLSARKLWLSATFDRAGISAELGGETYGGYVNAGLSFFFGDQSRWIAWASGSRINLEQLTDVLAPQNFRLTGPADFTTEVDAAGSRIDRWKGKVRSNRPGILTISKMDELIANIPREWGLFKTSATRAALETIRDFPYDSAQADFWFVQNQGKLTLRLPGKTGSRNLDLYLHADQSPDGRWKNLKKKNLSP